MEQDDVMNGTGIDPAIVRDPIQPEPAPGAEEKKPDSPVTEAEDKNSAQEETPEQKEARRESRRSRARARDAAKLASAETENRMLREQLERAPAKSTPTAEPKREEFDSLEDFNKAVIRHEAKTEARKTIDEDRQVQTERETKARTVETDRKVAEAWSKGEETFRKEAKDYDEVVAEFVESDLSDLDNSTRRAILESEVGQRVLYHLAKNPDEAERIAQLSPVRQVIEIGKLEEKVLPAKRSSNAPAPVSGVKGGSAANGYREGMSDAEYRALRKSQGARWAQ